MFSRLRAFFSNSATKPLSAENPATTTVNDPIKFIKFKALNLLDRAKFHCGHAASAVFNRLHYFVKIAFITISDGLYFVKNKILNLYRRDQDSFYVAAQKGDLNTIRALIKKGVAAAGEHNYALNFNLRNHAGTNNTQREQIAKELLEIPSVRNEIARQEKQESFNYSFNLAIQLGNPEIIAAISNTPYRKSQSAPAI